MIVACGGATTTSPEPTTPPASATVVPPSRARRDHDLVFRIDGNRLLMSERGRTEAIMVLVEGDLAFH